LNFLSPLKYASLVLVFLAIHKPNAVIEIK
jgi:hypothetical protein